MTTPKRLRRSESTSLESFTTAIDYPRPTTFPVPIPPAERARILSNLRSERGKEGSGEANSGGEEQQHQHYHHQITDRERRHLDRVERAAKQSERENDEAAQRATNLYQEIVENTRRLAEEAEKKLSRKEEQMIQMGFRRQWEERREKNSGTLSGKPRADPKERRGGRWTLGCTSFGFDPEAGLVKKGPGGRRRGDGIASEDSVSVPVTGESHSGEDPARSAARPPSRNLVSTGTGPGTGTDTGIDTWGIEAGGPGRIGGFRGSDMHREKP